MNDQLNDEPMLWAAILIGCTVCVLFAPMLLRMFLWAAGI